MADAQDSTENTWAATARLVKNEANGLGFSASRFPNFDRIIIEKMAGTTSRGLAVNLAALRQFLIPRNAVHMPMIAQAIGEEIARGRIDGDLASIEGVGAQQIYNHLLKLQQHGKSIFRKNPYAWELPPLEETPFSAANLSAAVPPENYGDSLQKMRSLDELLQESPDAQKIADPIAQSLEITEGLITTANKLRSLDTLEEQPRAQSVDEARIILRWLRNLQFADRDLEEFLDQGTPPAIVSKKDGLRKLSEIFTAHLLHLRSINKNVADNDAAIRNARDAIDSVALEVAEHTRMLLPDGSPEEARVNTLIDSLPESAKMRQNQSLEQLLDTMELGLQRMSGKNIELSPLDRLLAATVKIEVTVDGLKNPTAAEPTREESLAMAREALQRLNKLPFTGQTLAEFVQNGKAEDKAAFAQQLSEVAETYKNLLNEAILSNGDLPNDARIKQATDAVSSFSHGIKLMAAKEMPVSGASSMQISAEAASDPAEWKNMQTLTIERLLKSAGEALEKAIDQIAQQQAEERSEEQGQDAGAEAAQIASSKKRHSGESKQRSGRGARRQVKQQLDISADDQVLKQGRFSETKETRSTGSAPAASSKSSESKSSPSPKKSGSGGGMPGIKASDLKAIQQLGSSLRNVSNQLKDIGVTVTNVAVGEKITPGGKSRTQQVIDRELQKQQNPTKNGPGQRV